MDGLTRRQFVQTGIAGLTLAAMPGWAGAQQATPPVGRPNVLFIICDDLNDAITGMGGHPQAQTPNINRLMKRGVRFTNAQCTSPLCSPSRASMLSGLYPHTTNKFGAARDHGHDMWFNMSAFQGTKTWMEHFRDHGYRPFGTGKIFHNKSEKWDDWHDPVTGRLNFGAWPSWGPYAWEGRGDDHRDDWRKTRYQQAGVSWVDHPGNEIHYGTTRHPDQKIAYKLGIFLPLRNVPTVPPDPADGIPGHDGWMLYKKHYRYNGPDDRDPMPDELNAAYAEKVLSMQHDRPFMLNVGINRPHTPLVAPGQYFDQFPLDDIKLAPWKEDDMDDVPPVLHGLVGGARKYRDAGVMKQWTQAYLANVAFADAMVGRVLDALDRSPHAENTLIVMTSDHGYHMGEKNHISKKTVWEEANRVPFVVAGPGIAKNKQCDRPISLVDVYPTLTDYCGLPSDPHADKPLDGHSIKPLLENPEHGSWSGPDVALSSWLSPNKAERSDPAKQHYTVRSRRYRYTLCNDGSEELYDHENDPYEWTNLASEPDYGSVKSDHKAQLLDLVPARRG
jgi:arylsulfatase A-like enzyme